MLNLTYRNFEFLRPVSCFALTTLMAVSCSFTAERYAPYHGQVMLIDTLSLSERYDESATVSPTTSRSLDTQAVNLLDVSGILIYEREFDGELDDTIPLFGDEQGHFSGVLHYLAPPNINAPHLPRPVRIILPALGLDTFLTVQAHQSGSRGEAMTEWGALYINSLLSIHQPALQEDHQ